MSENPGCLGAIFHLLGGSASVETGATSTESLPYRLRDDFLSPAELAFYRVLVTSVDGEATATILGHGQTLIDEYHHLMDSYLKDSETMRQHLETRGVTIPAKVLQTG